MFQREFPEDSAKWQGRENQDWPLWSRCVRCSVHQICNAGNLASMQGRKAPFPDACRAIESLAAVKPPSSESYKTGPPHNSCLFQSPSHIGVYMPALMTLLIDSLPLTICPSVPLSPSLQEQVLHCKIKGQTGIGSYTPF